LDVIPSHERAALIDDAKYYKLKGLLRDDKRLRQRKIGWVKPEETYQSVKERNWLIEKKLVIAVTREPNEEPSDWVIGMSNLPVGKGKWSWRLELYRGKNKKEDIYYGVVPYDLPQRRGAMFNDYGWWLTSTGHVFGETASLKRSSVKLPAPEGGDNEDDSDSEGDEDSKVVIVELDMDSHTLGFVVNGESTGVLFENLPDAKPLCLAVALLGKDAGARIRTRDT